MGRGGAGGAVVMRLLGRVVACGPYVSKALCRSQPSPTHLA
jgi:hypothetical protein